MLSRSFLSNNFKLLVILLGFINFDDVDGEKSLKVDNLLECNDLFEPERCNIYNLYF